MHVIGRLCHLSVVSPSTVFNHFLRRNTLANQTLIARGGSMEKENESLYKLFRAHDQDGGHDAASFKSSSEQGVV